MDTFARLIVRVVLPWLAFAALCMLLAISDAHAISSVGMESTSVYTCFNPGNSADQTTGSSPSEACSGIVAHLSARIDRGYYWETKTATIGTCGTGWCGYSMTTVLSCKQGGCGVNSTPSTSSGTMAWSGPVITTACPANSTAVSGGSGTSACACNATYIPSSDGKKCNQYTCPPSGSYSAVTQPDQKVPNAGDSICTGGCSYKPSSWKVGEDGQIWATWPFKSSGGFCKGDPSATNPSIDTGEKNSASPAPVPCGANQCPGTVNGQTMCVPCKKQQTEGPSTTASAPSGSASGAGTTTTSTSTSCNGTTCTTTTTTRNETGAVIGEVEKTQEQPSFCRENPESALCKQSSFGGQCAATTCEGDAVQCAIAADQYRRNCQWFDDPNTVPLKEAGEQAMSGGLQGADHPYVTATAQSVDFASTIDQTDRLGAGCPSDVSFGFWGGQSLTIGFSSLCSTLAWLGNLLVGVTWLACAFIVFRN